MNKWLAELKTLRATKTSKGGTCKTRKSPFGSFAGSLPKYFPPESCTCFPDEVKEEEGLDLLKMPLSEFARSGVYVELNSKILGERLIFAAANVEIPPDSRLVVYRASELHLLGRCPPDELRKIHALKAAFDGEVVALGRGR